MGVFRIPFFGLKRNNYKIDNYTRVHKKIFDLYHEYYGDMLHFIQYIDNIKNHEKVAILFPQEDIEKILSSMSLCDVESKLSSNTLNALYYFRKENKFYHKKYPTKSKLYFLLR